MISIARGGSWVHVGSVRSVPLFILHLFTVPLSNRVNPHWAETLRLCPKSTEDEKLADISQLSPHSHAPPCTRPSKSQIQFNQNLQNEIKQRSINQSVNQSTSSSSSSSSVGGGNAGDPGSVLEFCIAWSDSMETRRGRKTFQRSCGVSCALFHPALNAGIVSFHA